MLNHIHKLRFHLPYVSQKQEISHLVDAERIRKCSLESGKSELTSSRPALKNQNVFPTARDRIGLTLALRYLANNHKGYSYRVDLTTLNTLAVHILLTHYYLWGNRSKWLLQYIFSSSLATLHSRKEWEIIERVLLEFLWEVFSCA